MRHVPSRGGTWSVYRQVGPLANFRAESENPVFSQELLGWVRSGVLSWVLSGVQGWVLGSRGR